MARELEEQMRNVGGGNFISEEGSVQLDMTKDIIVTVTGCGVVTMWSRKTFLPLYRNHHHGYEPVLGVRCLADLVVTGGILADGAHANRARLLFGCHPPQPG